jgi:polar amino acid transport system substrate-binding protein
MPHLTKQFSALGMQIFGACALVLFSHAVQAEACKAMIASGNPEYSPYLWRDPSNEGKLIGANADFIQLLAKEIGIPIEVKYVGPWSRVQEEARNGRIDLIAGAFFTQPRLEYMDYFYPAFRGTRSVIWTNPAKNFPYKEWSDLRGRRGLTVINNSFGDEFDRYAKKSLEVATVPSLEQALKMLTLSRADYVIYEEAPGLAYAAKLNITGLVTAPIAISSENLHLTMSHKSACNTGEIRGRIAKAVFKLNKDNVMSQLVETNMQRWRKQK